MVYNENGGYTELSHEFSNEMYEVIKPIIDKFQEKGMSVEAIAYVSYNEVERICLMNRIRKRQEQKEEAKDENIKL